MTNQNHPQEAVAADVGKFAGADAPSDNAHRWIEIYDQMALGADARRAWDAFKTFGSIDGWHPATLNCRLILGREGVAGAVREFDVQGGGQVMSELLNYDEAGRHFRYRILKTNLPLYSYVGEMWVTENAAGGCTVHWKGAFKRPLGSPADQDGPTRALVQHVFTTGLEGIKVKVAS